MCVDFFLSFERESTRSEDISISVFFYVGIFFPILSDEGSAFTEEFPILDIWCCRAVF